MTDIKYFGCTYFSGHLRHNQNVEWWPNNRLGSFTYTHWKFKSLNDDRRYIKAKRFLKKKGYVYKWQFDYLLECNPYHFTKLLENVEIR